MRVGFLGTPCSGKSTTAAMLFANLKLRGHAVEFIPEYARHYIAKNSLTTLTDIDQWRIFGHQLDLEEESNRVFPRETVCLSDTIPYAAFLYMQNPPSTDILTVYDHLFVCQSVPLPSKVDRQRVHGVQAIHELDDKVWSLVDRLRGANPDRITYLYGIPEDRLATALQSLEGSGCING